MMIDIEKELQRMTSEFNLTEKEVARNWRTVVRSAWNESCFKKQFYKLHAIRMQNDNPRSKKRFPIVVKYKCAICGELFSATDTELDHINGENQMLTFSDAENFTKTILFPSPSELQILCKDKKRKVAGKSVVGRFGCHGILTYSERYGVSLEQARAEKEAIQLVKLKKDKEWLLERGLTVPTTEVKRRELIVKTLLQNEC